MIETLQRFGDVVIADVAQGRNMYQMPLNVFCVVDGAGRTRNVAYVVQDRQDHDAHQWALQQLVSASGSKPSVIMSDQDAAFMSAYPNRRSWAAAWTRTQFTANTRTTGRVESENGVNKMLSSRKTTLMELFPRLLQRAAQQGDSGDGNSSFLSRNADAVEDYFQE
ncbi:unnamed protein product, partial [Tilletia controversa]